MSGPGTAERLDDLEWLIGGGVWPPDAVARVGWTVGAAQIAARRRGMTRLARTLDTHTKKEDAC